VTRADPDLERRERLGRLLGGEALKPLRTRLRLRFARGQVAELLTLHGLAAHEREALAGLLGRRDRAANSLRVRLCELDDTLRRAGLSESLRHALELLDGDIPDLRAEHDERERRWQAAFAAATEPRLRALVSESAGRGLVKRLSGGRPERAGDLLASTARVLSRLPVQGVPRSQLAAQVLGDAHALDAGQPLATLVLAALRAKEDERDRHTWARAGVLVNEFAKPALVLNLEADPDTPAGGLLRSARAAGEPVHLSLRTLLRAPPRLHVRERPVFVCENANLLSIAADRLGCACAPLVCTDGMPSASQRTLLAQLAAQGARLLYHGDFDWPGITIGNFVMRSFGAAAWRFDARHHLVRPGRPLAGAPVTASWDPALAPAMLAGGYVLEEEAVAELLLKDLQD
jgi:uncharacterized protein (TIGR02679 family)